MGGWTGRIVYFTSIVFTFALSSPFEVKTSLTGYYEVLVNGSLWLMYADRFFYINGVRYRVSVWEDSLHLETTNYTSGSDKLGSWNCVNYWYYAGEVPLLLSIKTYTNADTPFAIFSQKYLVSVNGTRAPPDINTISGFPSFDVFMSTPGLGYISFGGSWIGDENKVMGKWDIENVELRDGYNGGPLCIFDKQGNAVVISAFNQFMSASVHLRKNVGYASVYWGIMGDVDSVPAGFEYQTIVYYSEKGINKAFEGWGQTLRKWYSKSDARAQDVTLKHLGYWTDYGSFYYNNPLKNRTYEQTILKVQQILTQHWTPVRYFELDDWWYVKENNLKSVVTWDADVSTIPSGMRMFHQILKTRFAATCGVWSSNTTYAKINGGNFSFLMDGNVALPNQPEFWDYLFRQAADWGLSLFKQDKMRRQSERMSVFKTDLHVARQWLVDMGAARQNNIAIQYSDALPRHALQSVEVPSVTQVRVSADYMADPDQWKIGITSILANALGLTPFKDTFWSNQTEAGNSHYSREPAPVRQQVVAVLSMGPVAIGDNIHNLKHPTRCCNADGLILKPSRPATAIDAQLIQAAFQDDSGPEGEVWTTYSQIGDFKFGIIFSANLTGNYSLGQTAAFGQHFPESRWFRMERPGAQFEFSDTKPVELCCTDAWPYYSLTYTTPVFRFKNVEVLLLGELFIWVPMSPDRVTNISLNDAFKVTFTGKPGEQISFAYSVNSYTHLESFALGPDGTTVLVLNTTSPTTTAPSPVTTTPSPVTTESSANYFSASIVLILFGFFLVTEIM